MILKVSVTVPVYNTSSYLHQCLDSLQTQTLKEIEFILIDDGSTDNSGFICDEYAKRDSRFRVIHQKNGGSAVARQTGLDNAIGEYIIVCDSDDWVEPDMYEKLYRKAKDTDADIVCCGYFVEYKGGRSLPVQTIMKELDGVVDNDDLLRKGAGSSWVKLVKRSFFEKVNAFYESGINMGEDALIVYKLLRGNPKIVQIKGNLYHYRRLLSGNSYTNNVKMSHIFQLEFIYNWLKENYAEQRFELIRYSRALDIAFACLRTNDTDYGFLKQFLCYELSWKRLLTNKTSLKAVMIMLEKILPLRLSKRIIRILYPFVYK